MAATVATSGIGPRIVFVARDRARARATLAQLGTVAPCLSHKALLADLSSMREAKRVGEEIAAGERRIDVLINNTGAIFSDPCITAEGLERTFARLRRAKWTPTEAFGKSVRT